MSVGTVSTYAVYQSTLNNVSAVENNLTNEQEQLSSGNAFQSFTDMGGQTQPYLSASDTVNRIAGYLTNHQTVEANVNTSSSILTQVISTANSLQSMISQRATGVASSGFSNELTSTWQTLVGQLNTTVSGQYLFSGTATDTAPVSSNFPTSTTPNDSYYQGSQQDITTRIDDNTVITPYVRADSTGFQDIFAGLALAKQGDQNNSTTDLQQAETLVQKGLAAITSLQATVGATASQLSTSDTNLNSLKLYWQGLVQTIGNTDIVSVSTQVSVNQGILQAAFQSFSSINALFQQFADDLKGA